jgi:mandelate racemase
MTSLTIREIRARAVIAPLARPLRTASGSIEVTPLILLDVETAEGITGSAYLFAYTPAMLKPLLALIEEIRPQLCGQLLVPRARMQQLQDRFRLLGVPGLLGMVISTLDMAYWDALGKAANMPVVQLLGGEPLPIRAYDSYGMVDPVKDRQALEGSLKQGFGAIKIKIGYPELSEDVRVISEVRQIIGAETALMVDYNQSQQPAEAIRRLRVLEQFDLYWFEEPVAAEDLQGHKQVRDATGASVQTGENWWFPRDAERALSAGACDFMMPDLMKIGGITGWLSVAGLAQAASMPVSSHLFVEASAHVLAVTPTCDWLEFLDFAAPVLAQPNVVVNGHVTAQGPGLGIVWNEQAVARYALS